MTYNDFWRPLTQVYDAAEAKAVARLVMELRFGLSLADVLSGAVEQMNDAAIRELEDLQRRLLQGEPVQYVLGEAEFCGRRFVVNPAVLIPRPETAQLCQMITQRNRSNLNTQNTPTAQSILDVGTGSGCIAVTLALDMEDVRVTAWDISEAALDVARTNAARLGAEVALRRQDALAPPADDEVWDVIVSNPPYICLQERPSMAHNVKDFEPDTALFVPDDDPLRFYRAIGSYALRALKPGGELFFELNARYAHETADMLTGLGFSDVTLHQDQFGKDRFISVCRSRR